MGQRRLSRSVLGAENFQKGSWIGKESREGRTFRAGSTIRVETLGHQCPRPGLHPLPLCLPAVFLDLLLSLGQFLIVSHHGVSISASPPKDLSCGAYGKTRFPLRQVPTGSLGSQGPHSNANRHQLPPSLTLQCAFSLSSCQFTSTPVQDPSLGTGKTDLKMTQAPLTLYVPESG